MSESDRDVEHLQFLFAERSSYERIRKMIFGEFRLNSLNEITCFM